MDEMSDTNPTCDPLTFLYEQRRDTALQLAALADRVTRGELAGVWAVAMPLEGEAEIVGLVESRHDEVGVTLQNTHKTVFCSRLNATSIEDLVAADANGLLAALRPMDEKPVADKNLSFSAALVAAKAGLTIRREGWNGAGLNVRLHRPRPGRDEATTVPLLVIINPPTHPTAPNLRASWVPSQTDLLAEDWLVVPGVIYA